MTVSRDNGLATRSTQEVIEEHLELRKQGEIETDLERNFADDVILLTPGRIHHGKDGVRETAEMLERAVSDPETYNYDSLVCEREVALLEWSAHTERMHIEDGVDSFMVRDGLVRAQTIRYSVIFREISQALTIDS